MNLEHKRQQIERDEVCSCGTASSCWTARAQQVAGTASRQAGRPSRSQHQKSEELKLLRSKAESQSEISKSSPGEKKKGRTQSSECRKRSSTIVDEVVLRPRTRLIYTRSENYLCGMQYVKRKLP